MAKGYWITQVDVDDVDGYASYLAANAAAFARFGARFLVRGGSGERVEGHFRSRLVVLEFPDYATALRCYRSPEYAEARAIRQRYSTGEVVIVAGYEGPQPAADPMP